MLEQNNRNQLVDEILAVLMNRDPIGINFGIDDKEYKPEAKAIAEKLFDEIRKEDLQNIIYEVFVSCFSKSTAGSKSKYLIIAEDILDLINK